MDKKIKIGVIGVGRGESMMAYCEMAKNAELVAVCDKWEEGLARCKKRHPQVACYTSYDEFLTHDMDAVVLANYANEHAPFAVKAMRAGKHVFSEVLPVQTMKEAVELVEAVEETGMIYAYGENYCYMGAPREMRKLYKAGKLGEFEYGEGEYVHNCEPIWPEITYGQEEHWRNNMYSTFYCTHSFGPIRHITGLRPVSVVGFEGATATGMSRQLRTGAKAGSFGMELITLENGGIAKSIHGGLYRNSVWYTIYGSLGRAESAREGTGAGDVNHIYTELDDYSGEYAPDKLQSYDPKDDDASSAATFGHGGSDFYCMYNFVQKLLGDEDADTIDVYEALDMFLPGMFAYRSILAGSQPMAIPDLRNKAVREEYRNDTACTDPKVAGDNLLPTCKLGTPAIGQEVYDNMRDKWLEVLAKRDAEAEAK